MCPRILSNTLKCGEQNQRKKLDDTLQQTRRTMDSLWYLSIICRLTMGLHIFAHCHFLLARNIRVYPQFSVGQNLGTLVNKLDGGCSSHLNVNPFTIEDKTRPKQDNDPSISLGRSRYTCTENFSSSSTTCALRQGRGWEVP